MSSDRVSVSACIYKTCFASYTQSLHLMRNGQPHDAHNRLLRAQQQLQGMQRPSRLVHQHHPSQTCVHVPTTDQTRFHDKTASMLLLMIGVRLSECNLRMHNPGDALDMANQLLDQTAALGAEYAPARHILRVVKALSALELGLSFSAVIDTHDLVQSAPKHCRQSCMQFARRVACKIALTAGQTDACSTESCCSNAKKKRTRPATAGDTRTTCSSDDVQDTAVSTKCMTKRYRLN